MPVTIECDECGKKLERVKVLGPDGWSSAHVWSWGSGAAASTISAGWGVHGSPSTIIYCSDVCRDKMRAAERLNRARRDLEVAEAEASRVGVLRDGTP
jgi:hypothetical protein